MVEIAHLMYARRLTNSAGGNLSCRVDDHIFISPRYAGSNNSGSCAKPTSRSMTRASNWWKVTRRG
jgi:hypothetical protein